MRNESDVSMRTALMMVMLLIGVSLTVRSCQVWVNCGYDCPIFSKSIPLHVPATFGGVLGIIAIVILVVLAISAMMDDEVNNGPRR